VPLVLSPARAPRARQRPAPSCRSHPTSSCIRYTYRTLARPIKATCHRPTRCRLLCSNPPRGLAMSCTRLAPRPCRQLPTHRTPRFTRLQQPLPSTPRITYGALQQDSSRGLAGLHQCSHNYSCRPEQVQQALLASHSHPPPIHRAMQCPPHQECHQCLPILA